MKQLYYTLFIFSFLFFLSGCVEEPDMNTKLQNASVPEMGKTVYVENTATTILVKSTIKKENGASLIKRGFKYWQVEKDADNNIILSTVKDTFQTEDIEKGEYSMLLKGLKDGGTYQITSLASNEIGIGYGDTISVNPNKGAGEVKTSDVDDKSVTATTARVEGILSKKGEGDITDFGFELYVGGVRDTVFKKSDGVDWAENDSTFRYTITGLDANTEYNVIAFACNSFGDFTNQTGKKSFKTKDGLPILADSIGVEANYDFVSLNSKLVSKGDAEIDEIGFCWTTVRDSSRPNIEDDDTIKCVLDQDSIFKGIVTDLDASTSYYARAFAKNSFGIVYSKDSIRISKKRDLPTVSLNPSSTYSMVNGIVTVTGELQDSGKTEVSSLTLYYSTGSNTLPGPSNYQGYKECTLDENGKSFSVPLKLMGGLKYYVRVYAKNGSGTASCDETQSFTTPPMFVNKKEFIGSGRQDFMTFSTDSWAFVLGGLVGGDYTNNLYGYTPDGGENNEGIWAPLASHSSNIYGGSVCSDGNSVYVIGGKSNSGFITDVDSYSYNQWYPHSNMKLSGDMVGIMNALSFVHNDSIIVLGGEKAIVGDDRGVTVQDTIYRWNGESWKGITDFPQLIKSGVALTTGDSVFVGLGYFSKDSIKSYTNRELWLNSSGDWSEWKSLKKAPDGMGVVSTGVIKDSCLYFIDNKGIIWMYNMDDDKWFKCSQSPSITNVPEYKIMKIGETIYILAINNFNKSSFVTYDPTWDIANEQD